MNMSIFSCDILNSFKMSNQAFKYQASEAAAAVNAKVADKSIKKRKRNAIIKVQNIAYYMQLIMNNLMLVLTKETDQSNQIKIQFVLTKTQHILLNNAAFKFDSQLDIQNQIQVIQSDITIKFQEIKNSIADLRFVNLPAANQLVIAESASQITTTIAAAKNAEKQSKTATKTADKTASKSYVQVAVSNSSEQN